MTRQTLGLSKRPGYSRLVITRGNGESVVIGDATITVRMVRGQARLTIDAPRTTKILRSELEIQP